MCIMCLCACAQAGVYVCARACMCARVRDTEREREKSKSKSNSLLYQTPGVYVQGGSNKQFNSSSDISFGRSLSKLYTGWGGGGGGATK